MPLTVLVSWLNGTRRKRRSKKKKKCLKACGRPDLCLNISPPKQTGIKTKDNHIPQGTKFGNLALSWHTFLSRCSPLNWSWDFFVFDLLIYYFLSQRFSEKSEKKILNIKLLHLTVKTRKCLILVKLSSCLVLMRTKESVNDVSWSMSHCR